MLVIGWRMWWRGVEFLRVRGMVAVGVEAGMAVAGGVEPLCEGILMAFAAILGVTELALNGCNPVGYE